MAINTTSLTSLISEFRRLQAKDSITPESLGAILQRMADLLATAGTSDTVDKIQSLLDGFKTAGHALTSVVQAKSDRNHIYANIGKVSLTNGSVSTASDTLFIQQATTERAGAMRAQQVTDLNAVRKACTEFEKLIPQIQAQIDSMRISSLAQISVSVEDGSLKLYGASKLISSGYVPYLFRWTRKRNPYKDQDYPMPNKKYCAARKGWNLFGSIYSIRLKGQYVEFSSEPNNTQSQKYIPDKPYSQSPTALMQIVNDKIGYGRSVVRITDDRTKPVNGQQKKRMLRFRYAIGFAQKIYPGRTRITPANLVSNLVEFSIVYDPTSAALSFSK